MLALASVLVPWALLRWSVRRHGDRAYIAVGLVLWLGVPIWLYGVVALSRLSLPLIIAAIACALAARSLVLRSYPQLRAWSA